jgi:hypothetical protein
MPAAKSEVIVNQSPVDGGGEGGDELDPEPECAETVSWATPD